MRNPHHGGRSIKHGDRHPRCGLAHGDGTAGAGRCNQGGGPIELNGEDLGPKVVALAPQLRGRRVPDLHSTVPATRDDEPTVRRERYRIDRLAELAEMMDSYAARDFPNRRVTLRTAGHEKWPRRIPAQTLDARS